MAKNLECLMGAWPERISGDLLIAVSDAMEDSSGRKDTEFVGKCDFR